MLPEETSIKIVTDLVKNASELGNKLDKWITSYNDYLDTVGSAVLPLKLTLSALSLAKRQKFKRFLIKFTTVVEENSVTDAYINKLEKYLQKEANLEYIAEIIDSSIESKSSRCSATMGYYAGMLLKEFREIQYKDMVILN
ncbi:hypothetical protein V7068_22365, partial [Bacillus sp. JJ634]